MITPGSGVPDPDIGGGRHRGVQDLSGVLERPRLGPL